MAIEFRKTESWVDKALEAAGVISPSELARRMEIAAARDLGLVQEAVKRDMVLAALASPEARAIARSGPAEVSITRTVDAERGIAKSMVKAEFLFRRIVYRIQGGGGVKRMAYQAETKGPGEVRQTLTQGGDFSLQARGLFGAQVIGTIRFGDVTFEAER